MKARLILLLGFIGLWPSFESYGFKIGTHAYLAREVLNDVERCTKAQAYPCVNISLNDGSVVPVSISNDTYEALHKYGKTYVTGTIGPDGFADILSGQLMVHPGHLNDKHERKGFSTGDWVKHLESHANTLHGKKRIEALAFAKGYAAHAAADTFAHTYVNTYAGDVYEILDEQDVEERHMMIETFIQEKTPPLQNSQGYPLGNTFDYLGGEHKLYAPLDFIQDALVKNPTAKEENRKSTGGQQLVAMDDLRNEVERMLYKKKFEMDWRETATKVFARSSISLEDRITQALKETNGAGFIQRIEIIIVQIVAYRYFQLDLGAAEANKLAEAANEVDQWTRKNASEVVKLKDKIDSKIDEYKKFRNEKTRDAIDTSIDGLSNLNNEILKYIQLENDLKKKSIDAADKASKYQAEMGKKLCTEAEKVCKKIPITKTITVPITWECTKVRQVTKHVDSTCDEEQSGSTRECKKVFGKKICWDNPFKQIIKVACKIPKVVDETYKATCSEIEKRSVTEYIDDKVCEATKASCQIQIDATRAGQKLALDTLKAAQEAEKKALDLLSQQEKQVNKALKKVSENVYAVLEFERKTQEKLNNFSSDIASVLIDSTGGLRHRFEVWEKDINLSTQDWIKANAQAMIYSTGKEKDNTSTLEPIKTWILCRLPVMAGLPSSHVDVMVCDRIRDLKGVLETVNETERQIYEALAKSDIPVLNELSQAFLDFKDQAPFIASEKLQHINKQVFGPNGPIPNISHMHHAFASNGDDKEDYEKFHNKMREKFSKDESKGKNLVKFPLTHGNITERIEADMNLNGSQYFDINDFPVAHNALQLMKLSLLNGNEINSLTQTLGLSKNLYQDSVNEILSSWLWSIDGNHQWLKIAPPFIRTSGHGDKIWSKSACNEQNLTRRFSTNEGLPLFSDQEAREKVFLVLFKGPMAPSFEIDQNQYFAPLMPHDHPYRPSFDEPFPDLDVLDYLNIGYLSSCHE
ncbi:MAG: hypothetical protein ACOH5I_13970 [Oligoflexus sp.]